MAAILKPVDFCRPPHHGSPLERWGNWVDTKLSSKRYTAQLARLGRIRSAGITDLRYGYLLGRDWQGCDRFEPTGDDRQAVAMPDVVACYTISATMRNREINFSDRLIGDGLVPLDSALGHHREPELCLSFSQLNQCVGYRMHHLELLSHPNVYAQIKTWLAAPLVNDIDTTKIEIGAGSGYS